MTAPGTTRVGAGAAGSSRAQSRDGPANERSLLPVHAVQPLADSFESARLLAAELEDGTWARFAFHALNARAGKPGRVLVHKRLDFFVRRAGRDISQP